MNEAMPIVIPDSESESRTIESIGLDTSREAKIRGPLTKRHRIIEIGPSHAPIAPKAEGWNTTVVDHASRDELVEKYRNETALMNRVEEVDHIWRSASLASAIPIEDHGRFDGLIASHVGEHFPDLVAFLQSAEKLLAPNGVICLALPDKRYCFDFFQPLSTTGDVLAAFAEKRTRHAKKAFFNHVAYTVSDNGSSGWNIGAKPNISLGWTLEQALAAFNDASRDPTLPYKDTHTWFFTPTSFELIMLELHHLGLTEWVPTTERAPGVEFYAWMTRRPVDLAGYKDINEKRFDLLKKIVVEQRESIDLITPEVSKPAALPLRAVVPVEQTERKIVRHVVPSIAAIIPLYNGAAYIEEALTSVLNQVLTPNEIIIVNDGSIDSGPDIVERIINEHPDRNIRLFSKENGGQSLARNHGVAQSGSDLIAFLDQDDIWYPNHLEELVKPFLRPSYPELAWVYSDLDEVDQQGNMIARNFLTTLGTPHPKRDVFECLREDMFVLPSASLISRKAFELVGGFDAALSGYEDDDLFLRLFQAGFSNHYIKRPLSKWRIHPESASYSWRMAKSRNRYARKLIERFPDDPRRSRWYRRDVIVPRFYRQMLFEFTQALKSGDSRLIEATYEPLQYLVQFTDNKRKQRVLNLLRSPWKAKLAYSVRRPLRPFLFKSIA